MSDITINLDGIIAFLASLALSSIFLVSLIATCAWGLFRGRRGGGFFRLPLFPHVIGMVACLVGYGAMLAFLLMNDGPSRDRALCAWLDNWVVLWAGIILALWPAVYFIIKRRITSRAAKKAETGTL